tara:strand:+ start:249 stop:449 length:201 start_codon:yes stop_codon:yes gene_type:complete
MFEEEQEDEITKEEMDEKTKNLFGKGGLVRAKKNKAPGKSKSKQDREDAAKAASEYSKKKKEEGEG